jgi:hypothetical protein
MEKVNLDKSKKIIRILSGKEPKINRYEEKLAAVRRKLFNADQTPGRTDKSCLFYYTMKYYHVKGKMKRVSDADVENLLKENPGTKIYFLCAKIVCPMGKAISGKTMESVRVKGDADAVEYMSEKSGVKLTVNDL